jgi:hypothetical protein
LSNIYEGGIENTEQGKSSTEADIMIRVIDGYSKEKGRQTGVQ